MKKLLVLAIVALFAAVPATYASIGFGLEGGLAMAQYDDYNGEGTTDMGVNIGLRGVYPVNDKLAIAGKIGYGGFFVGEEEYDDGTTVTTTLNDLYIEVDGHYLFNEKFFGIVGVGMHMYTFEAEAEFEVSGTTYTLTADNSESKFGFNVGAGYMFSEKFSADVRYLMIADINQIKVNVAYMFR